MNKNSLFALFAFFVFGIQAQQPAFNELRILITKAQPEIDFNEKLIAYCILEDEAAAITANAYRDMYLVYSDARLKGGSLGIVLVLLKTGAVEINGKESIQNANFYPEIKKSGIKNGVFDSNGNLVYRDLQSERVFNSVRNLITR